MNITDYMERTLIHRNTISVLLTATQEVLDPPEEPRLDTMEEHPLVKDHLPLIRVLDHRMAAEAYRTIHTPVEKAHPTITEGVSFHPTEMEEECLLPTEEAHHFTPEVEVECHFPVEEDLRHQEDPTPRRRLQHLGVYP